MTLQLGMSREDRDPADVLTTWALKEYERLQQEAPTLGGGSVTLFKKTFTNENQAIPDVAEDEFIIKVYNPMAVPVVNIKLPEKDISVVSSTDENV